MKMSLFSPISITFFPGAMTHEVANNKEPRTCQTAADFQKTTILQTKVLYYHTLKKSHLEDHDQHQGADAVAPEETTRIVRHEGTCRNTITSAF